ncbi:hypothetical protein NCS56_00240000 [Fusarium sp. Ph1]|nr:hypothetical protein NCS56_00240000 [Fusarium sp. Ph1]
MLPEVTARKSRHSYGVAIKRNILALRDYDPEQDKVEIGPDGQRATTRLSWCVFAGDEVDRSPVYIRDLNYISDQIPERLEFEIVYSVSGTVHNRPSPGVKNLGRAECVWDKSLRLKRDKSGRYNKLTLAMVFEGEQPKLRLGKF